MSFSALIKNLNIQAEYHTFFSEFIDSLINAFGDDLHSVYACGSIPKGKAVLNQSDADFTIVFHDDINVEAKSMLAALVKRSLRLHPYIIKIDTPHCSVSEVMDSPLGWGFWIGIVSICVYGEDLSKRLPAITPTLEFKKEINSDTISNCRDLFSNIQQNPEDSRSMQKLLRRYVLTLYSLSLKPGDNWSDSTKIMLDTSSRLYAKSRNFKLLKEWFTSIVESPIDPEVSKIQPKLSVSLSELKELQTFIEFELEFKLDLRTL